MRVTVFKVNFPHKKFQSNMKTEDDYLSWRKSDIWEICQECIPAGLKQFECWMDVDGEVHGIV